MAKVRLPALSGIASGKLGDVVFYRRWGTDVVRLRVKPANPNTQMQQLVRWNLSALSQAWKGSGDKVMDDGQGNLYVVLKLYDPNTQTVSDVNFNVLTDAERQSWIDYATNVLKKPQAYGRLRFIGDNNSRLRYGQQPIRVPA